MADRHSDEFKGDAVRTALTSCLTRRQVTRIWTWDYPRLRSVSDSFVGMKHLPRHWLIWFGWT